MIESVAQAIDKDIAVFSLFGNQDAIRQIMHEHYPELLDHKNVVIYHSHNVTDAAQRAIHAVKNNEADLLMKGNIRTAELMKLVLHKENGLRTDRILSHVAVFEVSGYDRFISVTDAALNIQPNIEQKKQMIDNAVQIVKSIGVPVPKVAVIAAVEVVNTKMPATVDASLLTEMNRRGQISDCIVDGPLALDNAVSIKAAQLKQLYSETAGQADILLVPNIETGNVLYKSLIYFANAKVGAVIAGAKAPIILTSRADSAENRLNSLVLALYCTLA